MVNTTNRIWTEQPMVQVPEKQQKAITETKVNSVMDQDPEKEELTKETTPVDGFYKAGASMDIINPLSEDGTTVLGVGAQLSAGIDRLTMRSDGIDIYRKAEASIGLGTADVLKGNLGLNVTFKNRANLGPFENIVTEANFEAAYAKEIIGDRNEVALCKYGVGAGLATDNSAITVGIERQNNYHRDNILPVSPYIKSCAQIGERFGMNVKASGYGLSGGVNWTF